MNLIHEDLDMSYPAVSVIVPVYNAEKTLRQCAESVRCQSFTDWELLLVDDGSTDASGSICDEYQLLDSRVKVFHKPNGGVSSARNLALDNASGRWVTFLDSDDVMLPSGLDLHGDDADMIIYSWTESYSDGHICSHGYDDLLLTGEDLRNFIQDHFQYMEMKTVWGKLFRRSFVDGMRFDEKIHLGEDYLFMLQYMHKVRLCRLSSNMLYKYSQYGVPFWSRYCLSVSDAIYVMKRLYEAYKELGIRSDAFEAQLFFDHRMLCRDAVASDPDSWYGNRDMNAVYAEVKHALGWGYRIRCRLLSCKMISNLNRKFDSRIK